MRINGRRVVFVAGVLYDAGGLFNWYWDQAEAEDMFRRDQSTEEFDRGSFNECHWTAFYFAALLPEELLGDQEIQDYIDGLIWGWAKLPLCKYCGAGCFFDGGAGCDEWQAGGFSRAAA